MPIDQRLIEDYIPIEDISAEARREKSLRKGHISTLHLWWARRPLVAARAAVYGALVPAPKDKKARKETAEFVKRLCKYPGSPEVIQQAQQHILQAHAERLTAECGEKVTIEDIEAGRAPRPRVLDMFAGGGAIPLEALRLGCEAYALDLNPVAHLIELCTLVYPQQFGKPDPSAKGCAPDGTWAGLAAEVEYWGKWVIEQVRAEIGDLYPPIPDPEFHSKNDRHGQLNMNLPVLEEGGASERISTGSGMLTPVAYLWTRTVRCKNPECGATVPLARQTWLAKKKGRYIALQPVLDSKEKKAYYRVVESTTEKGLVFDPAAGSKGGNVACPFCGTVADNNYIKSEGKSERIGKQLIAIVCTRPRSQGKIYLSSDNLPLKTPDDDSIWFRVQRLEKNSQNDQAGPITKPSENLPLVDARGAFFVKLYGFESWGKLFTPRQLLSLLSFVKETHHAFIEMSRCGYSSEQAKAIASYLGILVDRLADYNSSFCSWHNTRELIGHTYMRQALGMIWDFVELNPLGNGSGNAASSLAWIVGYLQNNSNIGFFVQAKRGTATQLPFEALIFDAVITDPPYYDNVPYSDLSDFFFVWLKRSVGFLYPEHFSTVLAPKKLEAIMDAGRHERNKDNARKFYEDMMAKAFAEAGRILKPGAPLVIVYAHKTTLGWATLVDALRIAGFEVTEAWPLDTEMGARLRAMDSAALASSIFITSRRREGNQSGSYEHDVRPELQTIVRERVDRLWAQGITGADLVIACVGAGLRAFTKYSRVEYANGEPVPADTFLAEVEGEVLEALLEKLFGVTSTGLSGIDPVTRFYILWRYAYHSSALDAGEAIVFAYPQRVELEGVGGLTAGVNPLVAKKKGQYQLRDFTERGDQNELGLPQEGKQTNLIDVLHRLLWLVENRPALIPAFLDEAKPDFERLRLVAQTLAGQTLAGNGEGGGKSLIAARGAEASGLRKLTTNWRTLIESHRGPLA